MQPSRVQHAVAVQKAHHVFYMRAVFLAGFVLFFINHIANEEFNIPVGEFGILGFLLVEIIRQQKVLELPIAHFLLFIAAVLVFWCTAVDFYHNLDPAEAIRVAMRTALFYFIILFYIHVPDKRIAMHFCIGLVAGYITLFYGFSLFFFATKSQSEWFELKYLIPTPAIMVLMLVTLKKHLHPVMYWYIVFFLVFTFLAMPLIGSRGAFLSLIVGIIFYAMARFIPLARFFYIGLALMLPLLPTFIGMAFYDGQNPQGLTDWLFDVNYATMSNIERTLMLNAGITVLLEHPFLGVGTHGIVPLMEPYFMSLTDMPHATGESPHNYYMEFAVPFGIPAMILIMVLLSQLYRLMYTSGKLLGLNNGPAVANMCVIGWIMLYQPVSSITRLDIFILMMTMYYGLSTHIMPAVSSAKPVSRKRSPAEIPAVSKLAVSPP